MAGDLLQAGGIRMALNKFLNEIKYLCLPRRKHGSRIFESKSKVKNQKVAATFWFLLLLGCGSAATETAGFDASVSVQANPFINRVTPTSGRAGETITLLGFGFSNGAPNNVVTVGGAAATANGYALVASPTSSEIESLTFTIPIGAATGASNLFVTVFDNASNSVSFTVSP